MEKIWIVLFVIAFVAIACSQKQTKSGKKGTPEVHSFHSEKIRDSIFENVIEITEKDFVKNGASYTFNINIPKSAQTPVLFIPDRVPLEVLPGIYPELKSLIVITPNWTFYDETFDNLPAGVVGAEPMASSVVYEFNRENGKTRKDSIVIVSGFPKMKFKPGT